IAVGFRSGCQPPSWDALTRREEARARAEARRLLYVACTRARDQLVIPMPPRDARPGSLWKELTAFLPAASDADVRVVEATALAPGFGLDEDGARAAARAATAALGLPVMQRARRAVRLWRELALWFPDGDELVEGVVDLVFEEEGGLVVVDYKTDRIAPEQ